MKEERYITEGEFLEQMWAACSLDGKRQRQIRAISALITLNLILTAVLYFIK